MKGIVFDYPLKEEGFALRTQPSPWILTGELFESQGVEESWGEGGTDAVRRRVPSVKASQLPQVDVFQQSAGEVGTGSVGIGYVGNANRVSAQIDGIGEILDESTDLFHGLLLWSCEPQVSAVSVGAP